MRAVRHACLLGGRAHTKHIHTFNKTHCSVAASRLRAARRQCGGINGRQRQGRQGGTSWCVCGSGCVEWELIGRGCSCVRALSMHLEYSWTFRLPAPHIPSESQQSLVSVGLLAISLLLLQSPVLLDSLSFFAPLFGQRKHAGNLVGQKTNKTHARARHSWCQKGSSTLVRGTFPHFGILFLAPVTAFFNRSQPTPSSCCHTLLETVCNETITLPRLHP